jgi:hypothetical protein
MEKIWSLSCRCRSQNESRRPLIFGSKCFYFWLTSSSIVGLPVVKTDSLWRHQWCSSLCWFSQIRLPFLVISLRLLYTVQIVCTFLSYSHTIRHCFIVVLNPQPTPRICPP